ncbi:hypothetical protein DFJ58DRAFT_836503 [Suillus subalutaceus]|uniref:uncharacterized protein n=1 Tax=Suillus subalutaceus TaxID=48586 RepID=UPI001B85B3CC|nr:uncharacterized protein DFJ58DRAFT_836503 [Suillus subalutaceus]KAG1874798.1 hypothetical protein DFJ58DRAFT_836503 [Suillus subalutaceus]
MTILAKHNKSLYKVTEKKKYISNTFLVLHVEAININNKNDYAKMIKKIISEKLKKVNIFIDMKNVKKLLDSTHKASLEDFVIPWLTKKQSSSGNAASHESRESEDEETVLVTKQDALKLSGSCGDSPGSYSDSGSITLLWS